MELADPETRNYRVYVIGVALVLFLLGLFGIHGSSVGVHEGFFGETPEGTLLVGEPRPVRADEWLSTSAMIIAQAEEGLPRFNENMMNDQGTTVAADLPQLSWYMVFEPQSWPFLLFGPTAAFALHWWILVFMPLYAGTRFAMKVTGSTVVAAVAGIAVTFASLVQWWFLATTVVPMAASLMLASLAYEMATEVSNQIRWPKVVGFAFWAATFLVTLYPPYQIMSFWAAAFFAIAVLISQRRTLTKITLLELSIASFAALVMAAAFALNNADVFSAFANAEYPGPRSFRSGTYASSRGFADAFVGFLDYKLQVAGRSDYFRTNQSEASGIVALTPFLALGLFDILRRWRSERRPMTAIEAGYVGVFVYHCVVLGWMFLPDGATPLFKPLFFEQVPHRRILMGLHLSNVMGLVLGFAYWRKQRINMTFAGIAGIVTAFWVLLIGRYVLDEIPGYTTIRPIAAFALVVGLGVFALTAGKGRIGLGILGAAVAFGGLQVHPLYSGLGYLDQESPILSAINAVDSDQPGTWMVDDYWYVNMPSAAGVESLSGTQFYGDLNFWRSVAPEQSEEDLSFAVLRSAHVRAVMSYEINSIEVSPLHANQLEMFINPCSAHPEQLGTLYYLSANGQHGDCMELINTIEMDVRPLYIYKVGSR